MYKNYIMEANKNYYYSTAQNNLTTFLHGSRMQI